MWSANGDEKLAQSIINDLSLSPFLRIWVLLKLGKKREAKASFKNLQAPTGDEFEEMLFNELWLLFNSSNLKPVEFKEHATTIIKRFPYSIWARITLARILEVREYTYARDLYAAVLEVCPSNLHALAGFIQTSIHLRDKDKAFSILREIKQKHILASLSTRRKVFWSTIFGVYRVILGELAGITVGSLIFNAVFKIGRKYRRF